MAAIHRPAHLTHHAAKVASAACIQQAQSIGVPMNIAIVDASLYLLHFERMPGAKLTSIDIAQNKAFTAAGHRAPTSVYKEAVWPGGAAFGLNNSNNGKFITGTPAQDTKVAQAGVDAVMEYVKKHQAGKPKL
ncbi:hypothetical protein LTR47_001020 [Exophiala xenobiotica]|nr:hypothetical protein LTR92_003026 [Exophiala xenobiotica]KAK5213461.1 hypothetical protein LTR41_001040 [Exophiala xenobiotica]KAK5231136.1 hypothetical protein LTR72_000316 [Exophiala xenobiotica]KAK5237927.1 hypothetical protein LTR47_001020 [Exophiala xenobiotica]KAK5255037.1 hypothetical protein LTS06_000821 [Exophiala xenobiotica]